MDYNVDEILNKLNITQLKNLISLYSLDKPHYKSTKSDIISYIKNANLSLDARMLINYFNLNLKTKKERPHSVQETTDDLNIVISNLKKLELSEDLEKNNSRKTSGKRKSSKK